MAKTLSGNEVVKALNTKLVQRAEKLKENGVVPTLAIVRVGERPDDIAYERGATNRCNKIGVGIKKYQLPIEATQDKLLETIKEINNNNEIHGCLLFRPLPKHFDEEKICMALSSQKDIDGITDVSMAGILSGSGQGYPPCTPEAAMEILEHYNISLSGKKAVVVGRSLVVGKPAAMMLSKRNATVTVCHSRTDNMAEVCRDADIVVVAMGKARYLGKEYFSSGQTVIDVGINLDESGALCGDVAYEEVMPIVDGITPVPGGVGSVTTSILIKHVIESAEKCQQK